jgi:putative transposase
LGPEGQRVCQRWVGTIRRECLDRTLTFSERQLWRVLAEYETHYNTHRPHRSLKQLPPMAAAGPDPTNGNGGVGRAEILGGLINEYRHAA